MTSYYRRHYFHLDESRHLLLRDIFHFFLCDFLTMSLPQETLESLSKDVQANPEHVAQQSTEALASVSPAAAEKSSEKPQPQAATRDEEGIPNTFEQHTKDEGATKQKKIAVLTSGGDSAGMNAAGEYDIGGQN